MKLLAALATCAALLASPLVARAEPVRILVAAGNRLGLQAERPLRFADNDAGRVRDAFVSLGGVRREHAFLLKEPSRAQLFAAFDAAKIEAQKYRAGEVTLVFYFSGHGDREAVHLGADRVSVAELTAKLADIPAGLRIAVTDACRSTREKGFASDEPFAISATLVPGATGQVWLHASSDGEAAQESDELQGALFTHAWLNGLKGAADVNGDARVTLDESFAFAHSQTMIRSARSSGVLQKPEAVMNLREGGPVVLTQTSTRSATLSLPAARDVHFLVYGATSKSVLSELWSAPNRRLLLRLPAGRYAIQRRGGAAGAAGALATVSIAEGEERRVEDGDFRISSGELLASKGLERDAAPPGLGSNPGRAEPSPHELSVGWDIGTNARSGFVHGPRAAYAYAWRRLALVVGGGAELGQRALERRSEELAGGYGRLDVELRVPLGALTLRGGAGVRAGMVIQTVTTTDPMAPRPPSEHAAFYVGPEAVLAARLPVGTSLFADVAGTGSWLTLREAGALRGVLGATGSLSFGGRF